MIRVCCSVFHKGEKIFGYKEPFEDTSETHGYCELCFEKEIEKIKLLRESQSVARGR